MIHTAKKRKMIHTAKKRKTTHTVKRWSSDRGKGSSIEERFFEELTRFFD
jgi:hypothetical protein